VLHLIQICDPLPFGRGRPSSLVGIDLCLHSASSGFSIQVEGALGVVGGGQQALGRLTAAEGGTKVSLATGRLHSQCRSDGSLSQPPTS
jgi:hypothetical protein